VPLPSTGRLEPIVRDAHLPGKGVPMIEVRPLDRLGHADHGWLDTRHHFSFADYHDPQRMGWGAIRVWNDDEIAPSSGFPPHPHRDMEIITYVRSGAITHQDSEGNRGRTEAGDVQVMSAGTGIRHAEYNLEEEPTALFQIWVQTDRPGARPSWGARPFPRGDRAGRFVTLASGFDEDGEALRIQAAARVMGATLAAGESAELELDPARHAYLVAAKGAVEVNGVRAEPRDGIAVTGEERVAIRAIDDAEVVLVDAR
jgi:redox-sensitive bicupin YhaK (pirin superfamily)